MRITTTNGFGNFSSTIFFSFVSVFQSFSTSFDDDDDDIRKKMILFFFCCYYSHTDWLTFVIATGETFNSNNRKKMKMKMKTTENVQSTLMKVVNNVSLLNW